MDISVDNMIVTHCMISWYGDRFSDASFLRNLMNKGNWAAIRDILSFMTRLIPSNLARFIFCAFFFLIFRENRSHQIMWQNVWLNGNMMTELHD